MDFKISLWMCAYRADFRSLRAYHYVTAVAALPNLNLTLFYSKVTLSIPPDRTSKASFIGAPSFV